MRTKTSLIAPCAHTFDTLAVQACSQVHLASSRAELMKATNQYLDLINSESLDIRRWYTIVDNVITDSIELWKINEAGERTCKLLEMCLMPPSIAEVPRGLLVNQEMRHA